MKCKVCSKPLPPVAKAHGDPYCSTTCARIAHGVPLPESPFAQKRKAKAA